MGLFPFADASEPSDSSLLGIIEAERELQFSQLVMIPSESMPHPAAVSVLTSALGNIYAEGLLKTGRNVLAVKVNDFRQAGGIKGAVLERRGAGSKRWLSGLYLDKPVALDDPYRYL